MENNTNEVQWFQLSNQAYNRMKMLVQVILPALATLYFALAGIWGFPYVEQIIGTITAVTTFLGIILGISTRSYNSAANRYDGNMAVSFSPEGIKTYSLELNSDPEDLDKKDFVVFKIKVT